jgi:hypothetical protein
MMGAQIFLGVRSGKIFLVRWGDPEGSLGSIGLNFDARGTDNFH